MAATAPQNATVAPAAPNTGKVVQVIGPVIDAEFARLPDIYNAVTIRQPATEGRDAVDVTLEVWPEMIHVWHVMHPVLAAGRKAIANGGAFVSATMDGNTPVSPRVP